VTASLYRRKPFWIAAWFFWFSAISALGAAQTPCQATVKAEIEVRGQEYFLADLLAPDACPEILRAAARVRLGSAPLTGSPRVLEGTLVRALLEQATGGAIGLENIHVPERVTVRRAGLRASCAGSKVNRELKEDLESQVSFPAHHERNLIPAPESDELLARPGQKVTLVWDQDGIRLVVPAVCLDRGERGQTVRARIARGPIVKAVVVGAGILRTSS